MKKKKMIKFRLIILMVLCAGLLLGAWIVRGHLIHEPFRTNVRQALDRKSTRLNSSHGIGSRMPSSA